MTDSAGVVLVDNGPLEPTEVWSLESSPAVTIGGMEEHGGQPLFRVSSAIRLSSGRIAVADAGALQIFLYTAAGQFLRAFGREGDGPGEFSAMFPFISLIDRIRSSWTTVAWCIGSAASTRLKASSSESSLPRICERCEVRGSTW